MSLNYDLLSFFCDLVPADFEPVLAIIAHCQFVCCDEPFVVDHNNYGCQKYLGLIYINSHWIYKIMQLLRRIQMSQELL